MKTYSIMILSICLMLLNFSCNNSVTDPYEKLITNVDSEDALTITFMQQKDSDSEYKTINTFEYDLSNPYDGQTAIHKNYQVNSYMYAEYTDGSIKHNLEPYLIYCLVKHPDTGEIMVKGLTGNFVTGNLIDSTFFGENCDYYFFSVPKIGNKEENEVQFKIEYDNSDGIINTDTINVNQKENSIPSGSYITILRKNLKLMDDITETRIELNSEISNETGNLIFTQTHFGPSYYFLGVDQIDMNSFSRRNWWAFGNAYIYDDYQMAIFRVDF